MPITDSPDAHELFRPEVTSTNEQPVHWSEKARTGFAPPIGAGLLPKKPPRRSSTRKIVVIGAALVCVAVVAGALPLVMNSGKGTATTSVAPSAASTVSIGLRALLDRQCQYLD